jgi:hypothetical protein
VECPFPAAEFLRPAKRMGFPSSSQRTPPPSYTRLPAFCKGWPEEERRGRQAYLMGALMKGSPLASSAGGARCLHRPAILQRDPIGPPPSTQRVSPRRPPPVRSCRQAEVPVPATVPGGQGQRGSRIPSPCRRRFLQDLRGEGGKGLKASGPGAPCAPGPFFGRQPWSLQAS